LGFILLSEIDKILSIPGKTILIYGDIGSGKSTFVRQLLMKHFNKALYISTVKPVEENLDIWFSDMKDETTNTSESILKRLRDRRGMFLAESSRGTYLSRAKNVIRLRHKSIEEFISELYLHIRENEIEAFGIDSIDPIVREEREKLYELINISHKTHTIGIFATRSLNDPILMTLFDGIIHLKKSEYKGRLLRTLTFEKMAGIQLDQMRYIFTLYNKEVRVFQGKAWNYIYEHKIPKEYYNPKKGVYSTCSRTFDEYLSGGLKESNIYHFHLGLNIPNSFLVNLFYCVISKWILQERKIQIINSPMYSAKKLKQYFQRVIPSEIIDRNVQFGSIDNSDNKNTIPIKRPAKLLTERWWSSRKDTEEPTLHFIVTDLLDNELGYKDTKVFLLNLTRLIRDSRDFMIIITKEGSATNIEGIKLSEISSQINEVEGAYVLTKIKPADRKVFALDLVKKNGYYLPEVIPIV